MKHLYQADDGKIFKSVEECSTYEKKHSKEEIKRRKEELSKIIQKAIEALEKFLEDYPDEYYNETLDFGSYFKDKELSNLLYNLFL